MTPPNGVATSAASTAAASETIIERSCARLGAATISVTMPARHANSAPRENDRYSPIPSGAHAHAAAVRIARSRELSPATLTARTRPSAATSPIAFQYVSGCSRRPWALTEREKFSRPGSIRSDSP